MAIRRYTESVNTRFEVGIVELLDEVLESDWCKQQGFDRSDLVRHLVRIGLKNFQNSQQNNKKSSGNYGTIRLLNRTHRKSYFDAYDRKNDYPR